MDVVVDARLDARAQPGFRRGERGSWARTLDAGDAVQVVATSTHATLAFYDDAGAARLRRVRRPRSVACRHERRPAAARRRGRRRLRARRGLSRRLGLLAVHRARLGYLDVLPLVRLQYLALKHGAQPYRDAYTRSRLVADRPLDDRARPRLARDRARARHRPRLGGALAAAAPRRSCASSRSSRSSSRRSRASSAGRSCSRPCPGYLNQLLRILPWWSDLRGAVRHLHAAVDHHHHRALAGVVRLPLRQRGPREHQRRADRGRPGERLVAGGRLLPRDPAAAPPVARLRRRASRCCSASGSSPRRSCSAATRDHRPHDRHVLRDAADPARTTASRPRSARRCSSSGSSSSSSNRVLLGDHSRFVTHGGKGGFRPGAPRLEARRVRDRPLQPVASILPLARARDRLALAVLDRRLRLRAPGRSTAWRTVTDRRPGVMPAIWNSICSRSPRLRSRCRSATSRRRSCASGASTGSRRPILDFIVAMPLSIPAVIFGVGFLLTYTNKPARPLRDALGADPRLRHADDPVRDADAARRDGRARRRRTSRRRARRVPALLRTHLQILVPLLRPTFGGAAALMFVLLTHEFAASLLVRVADDQRDGDDPLRLLRERHLSARRRASR